MTRTTRQFCFGRRRRNAWFQKSASRIPAFDIGESGGLRVDSRYTRLLLSFLKGVWEQVEDLGNDPDWRETVSRVILDLATRAIVGVAPCQATDPRTRLRKAVIEHITANLADPKLRTSTIATAVGVSARTVQTVFERMVTTASAFILDERLRRAASKLRDRSAKASITVIAYDCGFVDCAYFSRCFRKHFGVSPRDYRVR